MSIIFLQILKLNQTIDIFKRTRFVVVLVVLPILLFILFVLNKYDKYDRRIVHI